MSSHPYVNAIYPLYHYEVTDKGRHSPAPKRVRYQDSPSCDSTTLTGPPILMSYRSEGSLTAANPIHCKSGKYLINR
jgi:hypothetical protein